MIVRASSRYRYETEPLHLELGFGGSSLGLPAFHLQLAAPLSFAPPATFETFDSFESQCLVALLDRVVRDGLAALTSATNRAFAMKPARHLFVLDHLSCGQPGLKNFL